MLAEKTKVKAEVREPYRTPQRDGYRAKDLTMSFYEGTCFGTTAALLMFFAVMGLTYLLRGGAFIRNMPLQLTKIEIYHALRIIEATGWPTMTAGILSSLLCLTLVVLAMIMLCLLHEATHRNTWALWLTKEERKKHLSIGFKKFTPYACCTKDLTVPAAFWGAVTPMLFTGILPTAIGLIIGDPLFTMYGALGFSAGGSDILTAFRLIPYLRKKDCIASDSNERLGCVVYTPVSKPQE